MRKMLKATGSKRHPLTPARFDMMRIIGGHEERGVPQGNVQWLLGVSAATVSKMLRALQDLGYVVRKRWERDRRYQTVYITALGRWVVRRLMFSLIHCGRAERTVLRGLAYGNRVLAGTRMNVVLDILTALRKNYTDRAPFTDPWRVGGQGAPADEYELFAFYESRWGDAYDL